MGFHEKDSDPNIEGYLRLLEACKQADTDGVKAALSPKMFATLADYMPALLSGFASTVFDHNTATVLPDANKAFRYVVNATQDGAEGMVAMSGYFYDGILYGMTSGLHFFAGGISASTGWIRWRRDKVPCHCSTLPLNGNSWSSALRFPRSIYRVREKIDVPGLEHFCGCLGA